MFSKHTRIVKHLPVLPVLWPLVRREGQFAPAGVQVAKELRHLQQISKVPPAAGGSTWTVQKKTFEDFFPGNLNESVADPQPLRAEGGADWIMTVQWRYRCCAT